jgi:antitoxin component HigA of HigAB toxin-antitoxin module
MSAVETVNEYSRLVTKFPLVPIRDREHQLQALAVYEDLIGYSTTDVVNYRFTLKLLLVDYESKTVSKRRKVKPTDILKFLMEQNNLTQADFGKELGEQPAVSKILSGKQELKASQIELLAERFNIYPSAFYR